MTLRSVFKLTEKYVIDNSPTLLSAVAATGTITVAYLTGKATFKAADILAEEQVRIDAFEPSVRPRFNNQDKAKLVWKEYIPPAIVLGGTLGCIVLANSISASRLAALAGAYKISEKHFSEYRTKALEKLGVKDEQRMRDEINEDAVRRNPPSNDMQLLSELDQVLFLEKWTGRYFKSTMETVKGAQNTINYRMISDRYATLSDFYDEIGLQNTQESGEIGWSIEQPMELYFTTTTADGGSKPCFVMEYHNRPTPMRDVNYGGVY